MSMQINETYGDAILESSLPVQIGKINHMAKIIEVMLVAVKENTSLAHQAIEMATQNKGEFLVFVETHKDVLEQSNRISSNQIRKLTKVVRAKVKHFVQQSGVIDEIKLKSLKSSYFSRCYGSIHDACLTNTITDIPQKLYDHAMRAASEWEPTGTDNQ